MRVTVDTKALSDGRDPRPLGAASEWWLEDGGLEGWHTPPAPRATSDVVPDGHGGYWPSRFLMYPRTLLIRGLHVALSSSLAKAECEAWLGSLVGEFSIVVEDEQGAREATGFQSAIPSYNRVDEFTTSFTLFVTTPDPLKYGLPVLFSGDYVENAGRAEVLPTRIIATGPVTDVLVTIDGHRIRWTGSATGVVIDTREGTAKAANGQDVTVGLIEDDVPFIPSGRLPLAIESDAASVAVEVRPGWR